METKICSKCKEKKELCDFNNLKSSKDGLMYYCKVCNIKKSKEYRIKHKKTYKEYLEKNKEKISKYLKEYNKINRDKIVEYKKNYYNNNQDKILSKNKDYHKNNKEKIRIRKNNYTKHKRNTDNLFYLKHISRKRIYNFLNSKGLTKNIRTSEIIGCSPEFLKHHIENQFTEGMCWDMIGKHIHIDHIIPLSSAKTEEEIYKLCHYTNLQPLWSLDNLKKGCKIL
jgi:hypothetical protein